jgi:type I restriction enzyme S subunit
MARLDWRRAVDELCAQVAVKVPGKNEQVGIVNILSAYDDLIANNARRIELLEQSVGHLFKEWFHHLRYPGHEHNKTINGLPEGWAIRKFSDFVEF